MLECSKLAQLVKLFLFVLLQGCRKTNPERHTWDTCPEASCLDASFRSTKTTVAYNVQYLAMHRATAWCHIKQEWKRQLQKVTRAWTFKIGWTCQTIICLWCFAVNDVVKTNESWNTHLGHMPGSLLEVPYDDGCLRGRLPGNAQGNNMMPHKTKMKRQRKESRVLNVLFVACMGWSYTSIS